ncbi:MAG: hypothetical protein ACPLQO_02295 [Desulfotomaculales bacterium]
MIHWLLFVVLIPILSAATLFYLIVYQQNFNWEPLILFGTVVPLVSLFSAWWFIEGRKRKEND